MDNDKKKWRARVVSTVCTAADDGTLVTLSPGEYTLSEGDGACYQLVHEDEDTARCSSLWFAELLQCSYMGQLEILGMWP